MSASMDLVIFKNCLESELENIVQNNPGFNITTFLALTVDYQFLPTVVGGSFEIRTFTLALGALYTFAHKITSIGAAIAGQGFYGRSKK